MKTNEGAIDRIIRISVGCGLLAGGIVATGLAKVLLIIFGVLFLVTGAVGVCPLYMPFGINTTGKKKEENLK